MSLSLPNVVSAFGFMDALLTLRQERVSLSPLKYGAAEEMSRMLRIMPMAKPRNPSLWDMGLAVPCYWY